MIMGVDFSRLYSSVLGWLSRLRSSKKLDREDAIFRMQFLPGIVKKSALMRCRNSVRTLILGSSHAYYGYVAEAGEFNLADSSLDFSLCDHLLRYWLQEGMPNLKNVVLFYDVFSPGNRLCRSSESFRLITYVSQYGYQNPNPRQDTALGLSYAEADELFARKYSGYLAAPPDWYRGNLDFNSRPRPARMPDEGLSVRVTGHLKLSKGEELHYVSEMIKTCHALGVRMWIVYPPLRADYRSLLPDDAGILPDSLVAEVGKEVAGIIDMRSNGDFTRRDFWDMDHLNRRGARKLSIKVRRLIAAASKDVV